MEYPCPSSQKDNKMNVEGEGGSEKDIDSDGIEYLNLDDFVTLGKRFSS